MSAVLGIAVGLALVVALLRIFENRFIYFPPRYPVGFTPPPENSGLRFEEVWMTTADGVKVNAWYVPNSATSKVLVMFHGNAVNIGYMLDQLRAFTGLGVNLLAVDYRGYGKSEGTPDEAGVYLDAEAAYRYLVETRGHRHGDIFVHGQSLGGAVAIELATRRALGGLIVESSFTSAREMARRMFLFPLLEYAAKSRFDSLTRIAQVRAPILVVHGTEDETIPFLMGRRLYEAAPQPKSFLPLEDAGHNDCYVVGGERYFQGLRDLLGVAAPATKPAR